MDVNMCWLELGLSGVVVYAIIAGLINALFIRFDWFTDKTRYKPQDETDMARGAGSLFWPVMVPFIAFWALYRLFLYVTNFTLSIGKGKIAKAIVVDKDKHRSS